MLIHSADGFHIALAALPNLRRRQCPGLSDAYLAPHFQWRRRFHRRGASIALQMHFNFPPLIPVIPSPLICAGTVTMAVEKIKRLPTVRN